MYRLVSNRLKMVTHAEAGFTMANLPLSPSNQRSTLPLEHQECAEMPVCGTRSKDHLKKAHILGQISSDRKQKDKTRQVNINLAGGREVSERRRTVAKSEVGLVSEGQKLPSSKVKKIKIKKALGMRPLEVKTERKEVHQRQFRTRSASLDD